MSDIQQALGNAGAPHVFEHAGKKYTLRFFDQIAQAEFVGWVKAEANKAAAAMLGLVPQPVWQSMMRDLTRDMATGEYAYHGQICLDAMQTPAGSIKLASLVFQISEQEMAKLLTARGEEIKALLELVYAESQPQGNG